MEPFMIRDLPTDERPRERLLYEGARYLSNVELLAILLRTGTKNNRLWISTTDFKSNTRIKVIK